MAKKHRRPVPDMRPDHDAIMERIDKWAEINLVTGCWEWTGHCNALGYAQVSWRCKPWAATRLIYTAIHGAFDPDLDVCHSCDNPMCVNPEHLRVDTHANNLADASRRKRLQGQWKVNCKRGHPLSGDNLYLDPVKGFRHCLKCHVGLARMKRGWPQHLAFSDLKVPPGFRLCRETGNILSVRGGTT